MKAIPGVWPIPTCPACQRVVPLVAPRQSENGVWLRHYECGHCHYLWSHYAFDKQEETA